jgi:hypothetical protein
VALLWARRPKEKHMEDLQIEAKLMSLLEDTLQHLASLGIKHQEAEDFLQDLKVLRTLEALNPLKNS